MKYHIIIRKIKDIWQVIKGDLSTEMLLSRIALTDNLDAKIDWRRH